jgi:hypothetical protein
VQQLELRVPDAQAPALPGLLGERRRVEAQVQVRAEAPQVELLAELGRERDAAGLDGDEQRVLEVRHQREVAAQVDRAAEVVAQRAGQRRVVPRELAAVGRGEQRQRRRVGVELRTGGVRVGRAPAENSRHLAHREPPPAAGDDGEQRLRPIAARAAAVDAKRVDLLAGQRLHRPAVQRQDGAGDHGPSLRCARECPRSSSSAPA